MFGARAQSVSARAVALDALRGTAVLWMTLFHFAFDLNHFGWIREDFYRDPLWTVQRTCILSLFLLCAGCGQAFAVHAGQSWRRFWRRWLQIAACALAVSLGSALMFPNSWIYFGVLHGMAVMLLVCRATAHWGRWLWPAGGILVLLGIYAPQLHAVLPFASSLDLKALNWLGLVSQKPITEDYVPLLPWLGVMWWGMAAGQWVLARGWMVRVDQIAGAVPLAPLSWLGRWSLTWYMAHQPVLIGLLTLAGFLR